MLHEPTDEKVNEAAGTAPESSAFGGGADLDHGVQPFEAAQPLEVASPFPLAVEAPPPAGATPADQPASPFPLAPLEPQQPVEAVASPEPVSPEAVSPFPLAPVEAAPASAGPPSEAAGTIEIPRESAIADSASSVQAGPSVEVDLPAGVEAASPADPNENVTTPPPVEVRVPDAPAPAPASASGERVAAADAMTHLMAQWVADGDRTTEKWIVEGDRTTEAPDEETAPPLDDSRVQPARWLQSNDGRRFAPLLAGAVLASVVIVAIARSYSHPAPPSERAETAVTTAANSRAAAAPTSAPRTAHLVPTSAPGPASHRPQVAAKMPRRTQGGRPTTKGELRICRAAIKKGRVAQETLAACRAVADGSPSSAPAVLLLARATYLAGRQRDSLTLARRAAAIDPSYPDPYLLIGDVEQTAGHSHNARAAFEAYLRLAPRGRHAAETRTVLSRL